MYYYSLAQAAPSTTNVAQGPHTSLKPAGQTLAVPQSNDLGSNPAQSSGMAAIAYAATRIGHLEALAAEECL